MRTTVRLDDLLLRSAKRFAAERGTTLTTVIREALVAYLGRAAEGADTPLELPASGGGGLQPGVDLDDSARLTDLMNGVE